MFIELLDLLRCINVHEETWLVASLRAISNRFVLDGTLGCPICHAEYRIKKGIADFTETRELAHESPEHSGSIGNSEEMAQYLDVLVTDQELRRQMGSNSLEIIARHDRTQVLDQWEALYFRLSNEFAEAKERKLRRQRERKKASYVRYRKTRPRIVRTSDLAIDQRFATEE